MTIQALAGRAVIQVPEAAELLGLAERDRVNFQRSHAKVEPCVADA